MITIDTGAIANMNINNRMDKLEHELYLAKVAYRSDPSNRNRENLERVAGAYRSLKDSFIGKVNNNISFRANH